MKEITGLMMVVLAAAILVGGAVVIIPKITGVTVTDIPGQHEGTNLTESIEDYTGEFGTMSEEDTGIGVGGLVGFIALVLFGVPEFASGLVYGIVAWFHMPILIAHIARAGIYATYILTVGVLLYRGVKA